MKKIKKTSNDVTVPTVIAMIIIVLLIEWIGNYCNEHAEEFRQEEWERFEQKNAELLYSVNWDKATYH